MSSPDVKSLAVLNAVREEAEASLFAETRLTLEESVSAELPDAAETVSSASEEEEEDEEDEDELSSLAQLITNKLAIPNIVAII
tara:strand:- start:5 stop:256 length:252 start_codon:yes stop_codon:yes gene_type:complete